MPVQHAAWSLCFVRGDGITTPKKIIKMLIICLRYEQMGIIKEFLRDFYFETENQEFRTKNTDGGTYGEKW